MTKNRVIIYQKDGVTIYWDKEKKNLFYKSPDYSERICMYVIGNFDLENDEYKAIMDFIGERV